MVAKLPASFIDLSSGYRAPLINCVPVPRGHKSVVAGDVDRAAAHTFRFPHFS